MLKDLNFWKGFGIGIIMIELVKGILALAVLIVVFTMGGGA